MNDNERVLALYDYLEKISMLGNKDIENIKEEEWVLYLDQLDLSLDEIKLNYRDKYDGEKLEEKEILSIKKPEFKRECPNTSSDVLEYITGDYKNFKGTITINDYIIETFEDEGEIKEKKLYLNENIVLKEKLEKWIGIRNKWVEEQKKIDMLRDLFVDFYKQYINLNKNSETLEFIIGNGILEYEGYSYPILLKKGRIEFDSKNNIIKVLDTHLDSEINTSFISNMNTDELELSLIGKLKKELQEQDVHPLDRNSSCIFLKNLLNTLTSKGKYFDESDYLTIKDRVKEENQKFLMVNRPVFFIRKRKDGTPRVLKKIKEEINKNKDKEFFLPKHLINIVNPSDKNIEKNDLIRDENLQKFSNYNGESEEILFTKESNREQLEIAEKIAVSDSVLVQGPPGTGKTHTIANLVGNFLSEGKNILITSHTKKALKVLKEKIPKNIQNLCVSLLDDDNSDMERSVSGICDYIGSHEISKLKKEIKKQSQERKNTFNELEEIRQRIYEIKNNEYKSILYNGEEFSIMEVGKFIKENKNKLDYIPGIIEKDAGFPATLEEVKFIYDTNNIISCDDNKELESNLPNPNNFVLPNIFKKDVLEHKNLKMKLKNKLEELKGDLSLGEINNHNIENNIFYVDGRNILDISLFNNSEVKYLQEYIKGFLDIENWMISAAIHGIEKNGKRKNWELLISEIKEVAEFSDALYEIAMVDINISKKLSTEEGKSLIKELKEAINKPKKFLFINKLKKIEDKIENKILYNGKCPSTIKECENIEKVMDLFEKRKKLKIIWGKLIEINGGPLFDTFGKNPEKKCERYIGLIKKYLDWEQDEKKDYLNLISKIGLNNEAIYNFPYTATTEEKIRDYFLKMKVTIPNYIELGLIIIELINQKEKIRKNLRSLNSEKVITSKLCRKLKDSIEEMECDCYEKNYDKLVEVYNKYEIKEKRERILKNIKKVAEEWESEIKELDEGAKFPFDILDAWKWKQLSQKLEEIIEMPFQQLQKKEDILVKKLREITVVLVEKKSWLNLMERMTPAMQGSLIGWKQAITKIGKGTGKNVGRFRRAARENMLEAQKAVPAWIMPLNRVMESLDPTKNKFDVVIVDEASQADITSLAIAYIGKKIVIVGDDRQVSPLGVGKNTDIINNLKDSIIKGKIKNSELYDLKTSLYDIAKNSFRSIMLKEHFRCVPDIIGYSNKTSYDFKIKPLREEGSSKLKPAVVSYGVSGHRLGSKKINLKEAETIVSLILSCIERKEYEGMSIGVISLLGQEQANYIQKLLMDKLDQKIYEERKILCGDSAQFQGDERDVIFLSMIDSNEEEGPLKLKSSDIISNKQRYNVACSRAKNQMWIVNSLDSSRDLKPGDIRKELLNYAKNPKAINQLQEKINKKSDSIFEKEVAEYLVAHGYNIIQQWEVGAYRIDMVAIYKDKKIAIECDGEKYHSGDEKIKEDMARQIILQRAGYVFIRIRGSRYFSNPELTMTEVEQELKDRGIFKENIKIDINEESSDILCEEIKERAKNILKSWEEKEVVEVKEDPKEDPKEEPEEEPKEEPKEKPKEKPKENLNIIDKLKSNNIEIIDKKEQSGILWVLNNKDKKEKIKEILSQCGYNHSFEKRGSLATNGKPAWMVRFK